MCSTYLSFHNERQTQKIGINFLYMLPIDLDRSDGLMRTELQYCAGEVLTVFQVIFDTVFFCVAKFILLLRDQQKDLLLLIMSKRRSNVIKISAGLFLYSKKIRLMI